MPIIARRDSARGIESQLRLEYSANVATELQTKSNGETDVTGAWRFLTALTVVGPANFDALTANQLNASAALLSTNAEALVPLLTLTNTSQAGTLLPVIELQTRFRAVSGTDIYGGGIRFGKEGIYDNSSTRNSYLAFMVAASQNPAEAARFTAGRVLIMASAIATGALAGDIVIPAGRGIVQNTPDGTKRYRVSVDNAGARTSTLL